MAEGERIAAPAYPLISIVTINYNQAEVTRQFLDSSHALTYPNYEIIVVDNASIPSLKSQIDLDRYLHVRLVRSEENLGFTGGNNLGMQQAKGEYYFIVNNDTELTPNLLDELLKPFGHSDQVGVVCPKIRYFNAPNMIQYAGYNPMNMLTGTAHVIGYNQPDTGQFDKPGFTNFAHGCAMLVSRRVVERVGRFAERFFLYYEELDWSQRIKDAHFQIYYQPSATILHKESVSVGWRSTLQTYYMTRNRILYMRRHCTPAQRLLFYGFFAGAVAPKHLLGYVLTGQLAHAKAFVRGIWWNLTTASASPV
ncbi:MAG: glycosyltransferase family 2 protein [Cytophagales bacterium]|nr:MAG: glycosyltransferase family 2 protein [Cytophagales bacterium]